VSPNSIGHDLGCPPRCWQEGYFGQIFWDELFAFPFLSLHFPELARELLDYRHKRLGIARERARRSGYRGAMYPWRSARSGEDETPPFQLYPLSGHWVPDHTYLQRHIGAAIAYDVWTLYLATGDQSLLSGIGGEMVLEIARFWASIAEHDKGKQRWVIRGVIGPDEYHNGYPNADAPGLDNNAYTNLMAAWTLGCALQLLEEMGPDAQVLRKRLDVTDAELARWDEVSRNLYLPFLPCGALGQFEGFDTLQRAPESWLTEERERLDWMLEAEGDSAERYQLTKQADVIMLLYLFSPPVMHGLLERLGYPMNKQDMKQTLDYHLARITHESSLSKVVCAGALSYYDLERSWAYFCETLEVDMSDEPDKGTLDGVHLGAMSGSLDVAQRHYLGVQPELRVLRLFPQVPEHLKAIRLQLQYRSARLEARLEGDEVVLSSDEGNRASVEVAHRTGCTTLAPGQSLRVVARQIEQEKH
jgi:trehalose/maltose hydrolase-like predicted phosphorylase